MHKSILVLDGNTQVEAGTAGQNAVMSVTHTATVSNTEDMTPGAACSAKIEAVLWVEPGKQLSVTSGTKIEYYRESGSQRKLVGTFWAVKPTKQSRNTYKVFAYDAVSKLDKNLSVWLHSIQAEFPMSLWAFAQLVAEKCGLEIANDTLPRNADYMVRAFYVDDLTGRELMGWTAQACGTFLRATPEGKLEFAWYKPVSVELGIGPGDGVSRIELRLAGEILRTVNGQIWRFAQKQIGYCQGSLQYEEYDTAPIDKVQIKQSDDDVGVIWPQDATGTNALVIQENLLLVSDTADALRPVAQALYEELKQITYRPCKLELFGAAGLTAGDMVAVTDARGHRFATCIMTATVSGGKSTLESTGNARRDSVSAVNQQRYTNFNGKLLEIKTDIDGMKITLSGKLDGEEAQTLIEQNLEGLTLSAQAGSKSSTLTLKAGQTTLTSAQITFSGMVEFNDLSTPGRTSINGANLTTGVVLSTSGYTRLDLDNGVFQVGKDSVNYVHLEPGGITWRGGADADGATAHGQIRATDTRCYFTSDTRYQMIGWYHEQTGAFSGLEIEQVDSAGTFSNRLNVNGVLSCRTLLAWDAKERVVRTPYGNLGMNAMESPEPLFLDGGSAVIGADGVCYITPDPRYEATVSATAILRWYVSPTSPGQVWVERTGFGAILHGDPGMTVDWMCAGIQRGYEGLYAEEQGEQYPAGGYTEGQGLLDASFPTDPALPLENQLIHETEELIQ